MEHDLLVQILNSVDKKLDQINQDIQDMKEVQIKQHASLEEHMSRTLISEERLTKVEDFVVPIKNHILLINGVVKGTIVALGVLVSLKELGFLPKILDILRRFLQ